MVPTKRLILSIFPGIDILGLAFEIEGLDEWCLVRGPDPIYGGLIHNFHPPEGVFWGVIGGPPCQIHSGMKKLNPRAGEGDGDLIPEFCRVVGEANPLWWLMENVPQATIPAVPGYRVQHLRLNNRQMAWSPDGYGGVGPEQTRDRAFHFGTLGGETLSLHVAPRANDRKAPTVLAGHGPTKWQRAKTGGNVTVPMMCLLQGLPEDFAERLPFTEHDKRKVIGNAVPLYLGRELARAIRRAMEE